jgi:hypothetical protein
MKDKIVKFIQQARRKFAEARKALVVIVPTIGLIVGTDTPWYVNAVAILVAAGVYRVPNAKP